MALPSSKPRMPSSSGAISPALPSTAAATFSMIARWATTPAAGMGIVQSQQGGAANPLYYNKIMGYIQLKYKKRYLLEHQKKL